MTFSNLTSTFIFATFTRGAAVAFSTANKRKGLILKDIHHNYSITTCMYTGKQSNKNECTNMSMTIGWSYNMMWKLDLFSNKHGGSTTHQTASSFTQFHPWNHTKKSWNKHWFSRLFPYMFRYLFHMFHKFVVYFHIFPVFSDVFIERFKGNTRPWPWIPRCGESVRTGSSAKTTDGNSWVPRSQQIVISGDWWVSNGWFMVIDGLIMVMNEWIMVINGWLMGDYWVSSRWVMGQEWVITGWLKWVINGWRDE